MWWIKILSLVAAPLLGVFGAMFYKWATHIPQDNKVEEAIEVFIENVSGQDIDLSPDTPERRPRGH